MAVTAKPLIQTKDAEIAQTTQFTAGALSIVDKFTGVNHTAAPATITVHLVPSGGAAGAGNIIATKQLAANEAYTFPEIVGHVLATGDLISTIATTASAISIRASGREVTN